MHSVDEECGQASFAFCMDDWYSSEIRQQMYKALETGIEFPGCPNRLMNLRRAQQKNG